MLTRLQPPGFPLWSSIACISVVFAVLYVLKYVLKRKHMVQRLPGMKIGFLDIWGDVRNFQKNLPQKFSNCYNVYILQTLSAYTQLFRKEMFFSFWFSTVPFIVIVKAEAVEQLIAGAKNLEKSWAYSWIHPWLNTGLLTSHGQKWKSRRKLLTPSFHFDILKDFLSVFNEQSQMLVNVFSKETEKDYTDISRPVTLCTLDIICETTLGVSVNAQKNSKSEYVQAILRVSSIIMHRMLNPAYFVEWIFRISNYGRQFQKDVDMLHDFTRSVIRQKKEEILKGSKSNVSKKRKALMNLLLEHHLENATLSEEDIREEVDTFTFEGHDTTSMGVVWALYLIGLYKDVQDKVHKELDHIFGDDVERPITTDDIKDMEYLDRVLKESQRLYPSVPMFARTSTTGTVLNGHEIPAGTACVILTFELHRDPDVFPNPEKFDPDRFLPENSLNRHPYAYIPFSAGPRNCIDILQTLSAYTQLFREKTFFCFWFSTIPFIVLVKAEAVEQLIAGAKNLEKSFSYGWLHPWLNTGLLTSHGQKWKSRRKLLTPSFHFDILKDFLSVFNEQSQMLVNVFGRETEKDYTDISMPVTLCTLDIICETTLGVSVNAQKNSKSEYVQAILRVSTIVMHRMLNPAYFVEWIFRMSNYGRQFQKDVNMLHDFTRSVIRQKKEEILKGGRIDVSKRRKALMDLLLEHHFENATLTEEDIREEVDTFTFEGHDTTSMGVAWALYLIGLYKDVQDKVHKELDHIFGDDVERSITTDDIKDMEYLDRVLKESQRLYPSVPMFARTSTAGTVLNGHEIPAGTTCMVLTYELHRDPEAFPNPEKFDPDRFLTENSSNRHPYAYIPFSAGPRNCIGQRFAVMEEKIIVAHVLRNFSLDSLEARDETIPAAEIILRNASPLKIKIRKRNR